MKTNPALFSANELLTAYSNKTMSPVEAAKAILDHIKNYDKKLNSFRLVDEEKALKSARASEERWSMGTPAGLVEGVPTTIKDLVATKGWSTRRGSLTTNDNNDDFLYTKKRISKEDIIKIPNVSSQQNNKHHVGVQPVPTAPPITTDNSPSTNSSNSLRQRQSS